MIEVTKERREELEGMMLARMNEGKFSPRDLYYFGYNGEDKQAYRIAGRLIQREKVAGRIRQVRHGVWKRVEGVQ